MRVGTGLRNYNHSTIDVRRQLRSASAGSVERCSLDVMFAEYASARVVWPEQTVTGDQLLTRERVTTATDAASRGPPRLKLELAPRYLRVRGPGLSSRDSTGGADLPRAGTSLD